MTAKYQVGDVIRATIPGFEVTKEGRPAVVIAEPEDDDLIVAPITKIGPRSEYDIPISGWKAAGLKMPCFARVNKPVTIQKSDVKTAGKLSDSDLANVKQSLRKFWTSQSM